MDVRSPAGDVAHLRHLIDLFIAHAERYYRRAGDGTPTREHRNFASALQRFVAFAGENAAIDSAITAREVRRWRDALAAETRVIVRDGLELEVPALTRTYANKCVGYLRRMVAWAVEYDYVEASVLAELATVQLLRRNRSPARETQPTAPADLEDVRKAIAQMRHNCPRRTPPIPADVLQLIMLTSARASEILEARSADLRLDEPGPRLEPRQHKTAHHGRVRTIPLCPEALAIVQRRARPICPDEYLFPSPSDPTRPYRIESLRAAITRACKAAGVPRFTPHQVRHAVGRLVRREKGLDAASALLGHARVSMTEHYAPLTFENAQAALEAISAGAA